MKDLQVCVGIDLARRSKHKAVVVRNDGSGRSAPKRAFAFSHDLDGFRSVCDWIGRQTGSGSVEGVTVNLEPTGGLWEVLGLFLKSEGADSCFTRLDVVSQMRKVHSKFAKSDRIDGHTLGSVGLSFPERLIPIIEVEPRVRALRTLSGQRERIVDDITRWKNRAGPSEQGPSVLCPDTGVLHQVHRPSKGGGLRAATVLHVVCQERSR